MKYNQKIILKNGKEAWLRNGEAADGRIVYEVFNTAHAETDYLLSYPDENSVRHRAELGISILKEYWRLGLGKALTKACIQCAKEAGYTQLELNVVAENEAAISLYRSLGFVEFGRNPRGFNSRVSQYQELVYTQLEL